jgi:hypothetical protein
MSPFTQKRWAKVRDDGANAIEYVQEASSVRSRDSVAFDAESGGDDRW